MPVFISQIADISGETLLSGLKDRSEVPTGDTWDLSPLFANDEAWEMEFSDLGSRYVGITSFRGTLACSAKDLLGLLEFEKSIHPLF